MIQFLVLVGVAFMAREKIRASGMIRKNSEQIGVSSVRNVRFIRLSRERPVINLP